MKWLLRTLARHGIFLWIHWSGKRYLPKAKMGYSNRFKNYTYRLKFIYLNKEERIHLKDKRIYFPSYELNFILTPDYPNKETRKLMHNDNR